MSFGDGVSADPGDPNSGGGNLGGLGGSSDFGWGDWSGYSSPAAERQASDRRAAESRAVSTSLDNEDKDNAIGLALSLLGFAVGGLPGAAISAFGPSLATGRSISASNLGAFAGGAFGGSVGQSLGRMAGGLVDGKTPSWGDWGSVVSSAAGIGGFPGYALGNYLETGAVPSGSALASYAAGQLAPHLGIHPGLAATLAGRASGIADMLSGDQQGFGFGDQDIYGGSERGGVDGAQAFQAVPEAAPVATSNPQPVGSMDITIGGSGWNANDIPFDVSIPDPSSLPARLPQGRTSTDLATEEPEAPFAVVLARALGGRRLGF